MASYTEIEIPVVRMGNTKIVIPACISISNTDPLVTMA